MLYTYFSISSPAGAHYVKELSLFDAFAQLVSYELGPFTEFVAIEPCKIQISFHEVGGIAMGLYESDDASELLPLISAIGYSAFINGDELTLARCRELVAGSRFEIDPQRVEDASQFNKNAAIALAVADIAPDERMTNWQRGEWKFALKLATLFCDQPEGYREELIKELVSA